MLASWTLYVLLGVLAGALTTVAGLGGGMLLIYALAALGDPHLALAATAPALLVGNLHRLARSWAEVDRPLARPLVLGALPGALLGGAVAAALPSGALAILMGAAAIQGLLAAVGLGPKLPVRAGAGVGLLAGALAALGGGAGMVLGSYLRLQGLRGPRYAATSAAAAAVMHVGRLLAYGASGMTEPQTWALAGALALAISAGNVLGDRAALHLGAALQSRLQDGVLAVCAALALVSALRVG